MRGKGTCRKFKIHSRQLPKQHNIKHLQKKEDSQKQTFLRERLEHRLGMVSDKNVTGGLNKVYDRSTTSSSNHFIHLPSHPCLNCLLKCMSIFFTGIPYALLNDALLNDTRLSTHFRCQLFTQNTL